MTREQSSSFRAAYERELEHKIKTLREALEKIARATDPDSVEENYRADDREGCLDFAFATANEALGATK